MAIEEDWPLKFKLGRATLRAAEKLIKEQGWQRGPQSDPHGPQNMTTAMALAAERLYDWKDRGSGYHTACKMVRLIIGFEITFWNDSRYTEKKHVLKAFRLASKIGWVP